MLHPNEGLQSQSFFLGYESFFADFPDTTLFYGLEAAHLGVLMRISVQTPPLTPVCVQIYQPFFPALYQSMNCPDMVSFSGRRPRSPPDTFYWAS
jgi:hypothetical protein